MPFSGKEGRHAEDARLDARRAAVRQKITRQHEASAAAAIERAQAEERARGEFAKLKEMSGGARPLHERMNERYEASRSAEVAEKKRLYDAEIAVMKNARPQQIIAGEVTFKPPVHFNAHAPAAVAAAGDGAPAAAAGGSAKDAPAAAEVEEDAPAAGTREAPVAAEEGEQEAPAAAAAVAAPAEAPAAADDSAPADQEAGATAPGPPAAAANSPAAGEFAGGVAPAAAVQEATHRAEGNVVEEDMGEKDVAEP
ncbi:hypothetical protein FOA52_008888 [Chlamydomonas sp. UWO 241]|nr:hypothetical protein FOA52_008888 [Chlamydomonas sp. UWO 241]